MNDYDPMPFGKYEGRKLEDVPASYLLWLWDNGVWTETQHQLHSYIWDSMDALLQDAPDYILLHKRPYDLH